MTVLQRASEAQQAACRVGKDAGSDTSTSVDEHDGPGERAGVGQDGGGPGGIEAALARAIALASEAGQWEVVTTLSRELGERRRARTAPEVASIEDARARRGSGSRERPKS
jgi:hypothetical protein